MTIATSIFVYLLLVSNVAMLAVASIVVLRFQRQCRRFEQFWQSPTGAALADQSDQDARQRALDNLRIERRIADLQRVVKTLADGDRELQAPVQPILPIENAVRMARQGASIEDLKRSCGLNVGEARLMQKLHGNGRIASNA